MTQSKEIRGSAARYLRPRNYIHDRILTKFGLLMGTMVSHHVLKSFQNWPPGGRDIGHFRGAEGVLGTGTGMRSAAVPVDGDDEHANK